MTDPHEALRALAIAGGAPEDGCTDGRCPMRPPGGQRSQGKCHCLEAVFPLQLRGKLAWLLLEEVRGE